MMMKTENLIKIVEDLINANSSNLQYKVYDALKMDYETLDNNKVNGIATLTNGSFDPIKNLGQSIVAMVVEFIHPVERLEEVKDTFTNVAKSSAGLIIVNSTIDAELLGTTGVDISYPNEGTYFNGTMGETIKTRLYCYFDINERGVLSNECKIEISNGFINTQELLEGDYYTKSGNVYSLVVLPDGYVAGTLYYVADLELAEDTTYQADKTYYLKGNGIYTLLVAGTDYEVGDTITQPNTTIYEGSIQEYGETLIGDYYTRNGLVGEYIYTKIVLPTNFISGTIYYTPTYEEVPYYKQVITRHRLSTTNKYENNKEMQTINDGQSIDISIAVPSIRGSVMNSIKDDMLTGNNISKTFILRFTDDGGSKIFYDMIASGDFSYEIVPNTQILFNILFVYARK